MLYITKFVRQSRTSVCLKKNQKQRECLWLVKFNVQGKWTATTFFGYECGWIIFKMHSHHNFDETSHAFNYNTFHFSVEILFFVQNTE